MGNILRRYLKMRKLYINKDISKYDSKYKTYDKRINGFKADLFQ